MGDFTLDDNSDEVLSELERAVMIALEKVGLIAEGDVKKLVPVDTGLLRNSITHAVAGQPPAIGGYTANPTQGKEAKGGTYTGIADDGSGEAKVFVGTNVEYAAYVEYGTSQAGAQPYLKPALEGNALKYQRVLKDHIAKNMQ